MTTMMHPPAASRDAHTALSRPLNIAVIGTGISGLSAAWLLSRSPAGHRVTVFESDARIGGHSNTVNAGLVPVDTGFIVYNEATYPNLTALFRHLDVPTKPSEMSFAVSLDSGRLEYSGGGLRGLFAQPRNFASARFWTMLSDLVRFYRNAPRDAEGLGAVTLDEYLFAAGYGTAFRDDHLYPMAAAIWSTPAAEIGSYPAAAFIRFCENHGLLKLSRRPVWRTVEGGSRTYVTRLTENFADRICVGRPVRSVRRVGAVIEIEDAGGISGRFDHVVIATHADQALRLLRDPSAEERRLLGTFSYSRNTAVLHSDPLLMPVRRAVWSSWNYLSTGSGETRRLSVTYWMNRLQGLSGDPCLFVTLNPFREPRSSLLVRRETYEHPLFDARAIAAQDSLWSLQGQRNTWFCGAYFGAGFHEDGLQSGLAVAEQLGGTRRPWTVPNDSGRISLRIYPPSEPPLLRAAA